MWNLLEQVQDYKLRPESSPWDVIYACTKADRLEPQVFESCETFQDVHYKIFKSAEQEIPACEDKFLVTGWLGEEPDERQHHRMMENMAEIKRNILAKNPSEASSRFLAVLDDHIGTDKLVTRYNELMKKRSRKLLQQVDQWLHISENALNREREELNKQRQAAQEVSLSYLIEQWCIQLEHMASQLRLASFEKGVQSILDDTRPLRTTFAEDVGLCYLLSYARSLC